MSMTDVYYYPHRIRQHREPRKISIDNGSTFVEYIHHAFGAGGILGKGEPWERTLEKIKKVYNDLQTSDSPDWKKIIATFAIQGALIIDEDRKKVQHALISVEDNLNLPFSQFSGLALLLEVLPKGLIAVNGNSANGCVLYEERGKGNLSWYSPQELLSNKDFPRAAYPPKHWA
ncbi:MAG: hypothetical protein Q7S74_02355 [Nanoarchaeota archaeon]|nr:hypothetical protein [Nanoarchaeota archaeon]